MPTEKTLAFYALGAVVAALPIGNSPFEITSSVFIALSLMSVLRSKEFGIFRNLFFGLLALYLFMNGVSIWQSQYPLASARGAFKVLKSLLFCAAVVHAVDSKEKFWKIFQFVLFVAFWICLDALIQGITGVEFLRGRRMTAYSGPTMRWTGPFPHANDFSAYLSFVIFLFFGILQPGIRPGSWPRRFCVKNSLRGSTSRALSFSRFLFFAAGLGLTLACLLGTYSRSAWLTVGMATLLFAVCHRSKVLIMALAAVIFWGVFLSPPLVKLRITSMADKRGSVVERLELWRESARMIKKSPYWGLGVNTYAKNEPFYKSKDYPIDNQYAHNGYLQMAVEIGCLGVLSFLGAVGYFFYKTTIAFVRSREPLLKTTGTALLFGILSFLMHSAFDTDLQSLLLVNTLWLAMGLAWAGKNAA